MESTKEMKNIKPAYAVRLGTGVFMGVLWMCAKCGYQRRDYTDMPGPGVGGKCPDTASGNHVWVKG